MQHSDHAFGGLLARDPLDRVDHDAAGSLLAVGARLRLDVPHEQGGIPLGLRLDVLDQLGLRVLDGQSGDPLQLGRTRRLGLVGGQLAAGQVGLPDRGRRLGLGQLVTALLHPVGLGVQPLLAIGSPGFPALQLGLQPADRVGPLPQFALDGPAGLFAGVGQLVPGLAFGVLGDGGRLRTSVGKQPFHRGPGGRLGLRIRNRFRGLDRWNRCDRKFPVGLLGSRAGGGPRRDGARRGVGVAALGGAAKAEPPGEEQDRNAAGHDGDEHDDES